MEKAKDILYDGMDYIIMVGIIMVIGLIINWRIGGLFTTDINDSYNDIAQEETPIASENEEEKDAEADEEKISEEEKSSNEEEGEDENVDKPSGEEEDKEVVSIEIPSGVYPSDIADILLSNGLITNKEFFLNEVIESGVEGGLRSGDYEIPKDSSLDEILDILVK